MRRIIGLVVFMTLFQPKVSLAQDEWENSDQYSRLELRYTFHAINFTSDASSEEQRFFHGDKDRYEARFVFGYANKFFEQAYHFGGGLSYHLWRSLELGLDLQFAPAQGIMARQEYRPLIRYSLFDGWVRLGGVYRFHDFAQANLQSWGPVAEVGWPDRLWLDGLLEISHTEPMTGGRFDNQAFEIGANLQPGSWLLLRGFYGLSGHDFEAGAPDDPFKSFSAHDFGTSFRLSFMVGSGILFEYRGQDRNNGQTYHQYTVGTFFGF